jgi:hypothetical protein
MAPLYVIDNTGQMNLGAGQQFSVADVESRNSALTEEGE